ncbi:MAG: hypothetical protein G01um101429_746 [Parcubacteria group bacterium Gr01-1014_29]|nr:MAG: hypothetical protein G01um101429_746 [Parcubacteria group bacterium Gr01-1014_29]
MKREVTIKPNSSRAGVEENNGVLEVRVHAAPSDGKANEEMIELLADYFEVAKSAIELVQGHTSRKKIVEIRTWQKR